MNGRFLNTHPRNPASFIRVRICVSCAGTASADFNCYYHVIYNLLPSCDCVVLLAFRTASPAILILDNFLQTHSFNHADPWFTIFLTPSEEILKSDAIFLPASPFIRRLNICDLSDGAISRCFGHPE